VLLNPCDSWISRFIHKIHTTRFFQELKNDRISLDSLIILKCDIGVLCWTCNFDPLMCVQHLISWYFSSLAFPLYYMIAVMHYEHNQEFCTVQIFCLKHGIHFTLGWCISFSCTPFWRVFSFTLQENKWFWMRKGNWRQSTIFSTFGIS
jgi:hypothetical protein